MWASKYSPKSLKEFAGNDLVVETVRKWALDFSRGVKQRPLLLSGPPGVGKTALAKALSEEFGWDLVDLSPSDYEEKDEFKKMLVSGRGLFGERFFLFDDLDSLAKSEVTMLEEFAESKYPMVFSANDAWDPKLSSLRQKCTLLEFKRINSSTVKKVLKEIASAEGRPESLAEEIASKSGGDLRSAILDLQANELVVSTAEREREDKPFEVVRNVLKARSFAEALAAAETSDLDLDALFLWIDENIPMEYEEKAEVAEAMHWVFRARLFFERASEGQEYRLWKYARALLLAGVASSKNGEYHKFSKYQFPSFLRRMGQSRAQRQLLQSALQKGGSKLHTASRKSLSDLLLLPKETLTRAIGLSEEESKLMNEMRGRV